MKVSLLNNNPIFYNNRIPAKIQHKIHSPNSKALPLALMLMAASNALYIGGFSTPNIFAQQKEANTSTEANYKEEIISKFGNFGKYYVNNVPDKENIGLHSASLSEICSLYKDIQGCEYKNPAVLNGLNVDELNSKVLTPAQKLVNGKSFGKNQSTLVLISFQDGLDPGGAFDWNLTTNGFTSNKNDIDGMDFEFDQSFLGHYDNIVLVQPNDISADDALTSVFAKLEKVMDKGSAVDIAFIGHGTNKVGVTLSKRLGLPLEKSMLDESDFKPIEKGGDEFAQNIKTLFQNAIDNGYKPRVIGMGCTSEFMQNAVNKIMDAQYLSSVKVFGTPYSTNGNYAIGFNSDYIEMLVNVSEIKNKCGLLIKLTDSGWKLKNNKDADTFRINPSDSTNMDIINNYLADGTKSGSITKPSGVIMQYVIKQYD